MEVKHKNNFVRLQPLIHQVGGHSSMLCLDKKTICKPLVPRELKFYETLPDSLKEFTPKFYGAIKVYVHQEKDGYVSLFATPPDSYEIGSAISTNSKIRIRRSGSLEVEGSENLYFDDDQNHIEGNRDSTKLKVPLNPWVFKCHRAQLQNMIQSNKCDDRASNFIVLENLTYKFKYPCILDLKMGTRQYGDSASLPKKQSKMYKVVSTTSGKLGVRIGGMQVFQVNTESYLCWNKFFGRSLSVSGFKQAMHQFLHNGDKIRYDVIPSLIQRLEKLVYILTNQDSVRFYTTSLLLIYDGNEYKQISDKSFNFPSGPECKNEPMFTTQTFEVSQMKCGEKTHLHRRSSSAEAISPLVDRSACVFSFGEESRIFHHITPIEVFDEAKAGSSTSLDTPLPSPLPTLPFSSTVEPHVDVRIIDFAHSTHKGLEDTVEYSGPDSGFLFGLENIIAILKGIEKDHSY